MITSYSKGTVTLTATYDVGGSETNLTITRTAPFSDDDIRRLNRELADYNAELVPDGSGWVLRHQGQVIGVDAGTSDAAEFGGTVIR